MRGLLFLSALAHTRLVQGLVSPDGTGRLPALGWNSWNEYGCDIREDLFLAVAEKIVSLGLKDVGYEYVNIDDCWSDKAKRRDPETHEIIPDYQKFPNGINHTAAQIHAMGLKLGIYSDAGRYRTDVPWDPDSDRKSTRLNSSHWE